MTIFNKEGKVYILKGPNPLVEKQENWDNSKLIFHNFNWNEVKLKHDSKPAKIKTEIEVKEKISIPKLEKNLEEVFKEIEQPFIEELKEEPQLKKEEQKIEKDFDLPYIKYKILSYCLPAFVQKKTDDFYGDSWGRVSYKTKFVFPMVMIESSDFSIEFWTSDPKQQISERSIIYPFSYEVHNPETGAYDKVPYDEYRWWKVTSKEKKEEGGWLFTAIPSDTQPDFSS